MTEDEERAINSIRWILRQDPGIAQTLFGFTWVHDGIAEDEMYALYNIGEIVRIDAPSAEILMGFPWVTDSVTGDESNALYNLREILRDDPAVAEALLDLAWIADGVNRHEKNAIYQFREVLRKEPAVADILLASSWFTDGLTRTDGNILWGLSGLYDLDRSSLSGLTTKPWFDDGLSYEEFMLVGDIGVIAGKSKTDALAIIEMPFLDTFDPADAMAARSLRRLAWCADGGSHASYECSENGTGYQRVSKIFRRIMDYPTISDGITDEETPIVATLHSASFFTTDIFDRLLDPNTVMLEERTVNLRHSGETPFTIIRIRPGAERTMDLLEHAMRLVEEFVEVPFPVGHIIFLAENTSRNRVYIDLSAMSGEYEHFDNDERPAGDALHVLAHEAAHHYWFVEWSRHWIEDGLGAFFQSIVRRQEQIGPNETVAPIWKTKMPPCVYMSNLAGRDRELDVPGVRIISDCSDSLGERLFQDLWRSLGDSVFRQGLANLYLLARSGAPVGECKFTKYDKAGICEVIAAFKSAAPAAEAATVDKVVGRWYDNSEPYDLSHVDTSPPNRRLPGGVEIARAYISLDRDKPEQTRVDSFSASEIRARVFLHLDLSSYTPQPAGEFSFRYVTFFEDGFPYRDHESTYTRSTGWTRNSVTSHIGAGGFPWIPRGPRTEASENWWAPGRHWVHVYHEGQKVAEVEFTVTL